MSLSERTTVNGKFDISNTDGSVGVNAIGQNAVSLGFEASANSISSIAIGAGNTDNSVFPLANGIGCIAIGAGAQSTGNRAIAIGSAPNGAGLYGAVAAGLSSIAIGEGATTSGDNNIVIGNKTTDANNPAFTGIIILNAAGGNIPTPANSDSFYVNPIRNDNTGGGGTQATNCPNGCRTLFYNPTTKEVVWN